MRSRLLPLLALVVVSSLLLPLAQAKTASDPDDLSYDIDFKSVSLTQPVSSKLSWTFTSWDAFDGNPMLGGSNPTLNLDTRSGDAVDYRIVMGWSPMGYYCQLQKAGGGKLADGTMSRPDAKTARCVVPSSKIARSKPIHWRALIKTGFGKDVAPNSGWVVGT
jgi:hypothetical protein